MTNIKTHPLSSVNSLFHLYKIDQNTAVYTFNDLIETANLIQNDLPFSKVAVLFKGEAKVEDLLIYSALKEKGLKPVGYYFKDNFTADVDQFSGLFYLPEDVRAVLTCELSLSCAVNYFATVRKIPAYFLLSENIGFQPLNNLTFIRNGHKVNKFQFSCKKTIAIINGDGFTEETFISIPLSALLFLLDYNLCAMEKNATALSKKYNAVKLALIDLVDNFYRRAQIESAFKVIVPLCEFIKVNQDDLVLFPFLDSVGAWNNLSDFDKAFALKQIFKIFLDDEKYLLSNYNAIAGRLGFFFNVDGGVVLKGIKGRITGLNNAFESGGEIKEEIFCLYKLFLSFEKNYEKHFSVLKRGKCTDLNLAIDFLSSLKE